MVFDFLEKLKGATEKYELKQEETITKAEAVEGLSEVLGIDLPEAVQDLMPDEITLKQLKIDRTTEPEVTFEIEMELNEPPIMESFANVLKPELTLFEVKTNQPKESGNGVRTIWSIAVTIKFLGNELTIKTDHTNPKRFEMKDFQINDDNFRKGFEDLGVSLPPALFDVIPSEEVVIKKLVVDDSKEESYIELETTMKMRKLFGGIMEKIVLAKPETARFYFKKEAAEA